MTHSGIPLVPLIAALFAEETLTGNPPATLSFYVPSRFCAHLLLLADVLLDFSPRDRYNKNNTLTEKMAMALTQVYEGTWEELAQHREDYGNRRLMLMVLPTSEKDEIESQQSSKPRPRFGSGKGIFRMAPGFDAPLEDFKEYME